MREARHVSLSTTDTAKVIRKALKRAFPKVKFSVRSDSYSGGSSIDVSWTDGPTSDQVDEVVKRYAGATFDGMIDLKSYVTATLSEQDVTDLQAIEDSKAGFKYLRISARQGEDAYRTELKIPEDTGAIVLLQAGDEIHWGADFVFTRRTESPEVLAIVAERLGAYPGLTGVYPKVAFHPSSGDNPSAYFEPIYGEKLITGARMDAFEHARHVAASTPVMVDLDELHEVVDQVIPEALGLSAPLSEEERAELDAAEDAAEAAFMEATEQALADENLNEPTEAYPPLEVVS